MYKALHQPSRSEIIILDPRWKEQIPHLRSLDQQDALVCPGCLQPVRVRAGRIKRAHFAHKHLQNCPFERESARLVQTRATLYDWLISKFDPETVNVEKTLDATARIRPFDCWVEHEGVQFAYWIFDRLMPPVERKNLLSMCAERMMNVQWVFVIDLLRVDEFNWQSHLHLTTTERAFMRQSELDRAWQTHFEQLGRSLHYLDPDQNMLTTYRNLTMIHKPQVHVGKRLQNPLTDILVSNITGEFIHPGEVDRLALTQDRIKSQRRQAEERLRKAEAFLKGASLSRWSAKPGVSDSAAEKPFERSGACRVCGTITSDWVSYFGETQECICRGCSDQR